MTTAPTPNPERTEAVKRWLAGKPDKPLSDLRLARAFVEDFEGKFCFLVDEPRDDAMPGDDGRAARWYRFTDNGKQVREHHQSRIDGEILQYLIKLRDNGEAVTITSRTVANVRFLASRLFLVSGGNL